LTWQGALLVAAGGAVGSVLRYGVAHALNGAWPWGTLAVNALGCAAIGALAAAGIAGEARLLLMTGLLGGFTTFSAFSLDTVALWERAPWQAALYVTASLGLGFAGFVLGAAIGRR